MIVHVLPGDAQVEQFKQTGICGDVVVCREAFVEGPARADSLNELWRIRGEHHDGVYPNSPLADYRTAVAAEFEKLMTVGVDDEVNLWFEHELFCQVNMWFCIWLLRETGACVYRVMPVVDESHDVWSGFGNQDLRRCFEHRRAFSDRDIELGADLWNAFRNRDYDRLAELSSAESTCLPYLEEVCEAEIEKETRPREVLRDLAESGASDFNEIFLAFRQRAGVYGFGDSQVRQLLDEI